MRIVWSGVSVRKDIFEFQRMVDENAFDLRFEPVFSLIYSTYVDCA